jgi:hypothetical protein
VEDARRIREQNRRDAEALGQHLANARQQETLRLARPMR